MTVDVDVDVAVASFGSSCMISLFAPLRAELLAMPTIWARLASTSL